MRSYLELIEKWEDFLKFNKKGSLSEFGDFLIAKTKSDTKSKSELEDYFNSNDTNFGYSDSNSEASYLIWRLNKFAKSYIKELFDKLEITNQDEFAVLSHVDYLKECSKKIAITDNLIEISTGIDIIKRLVKKGYLSERKNPNDKRENLIRLSKKGKEKLKEIYIGFSSVPDILINITQEEKHKLVEILKKLDKAHTEKIE